MVGTASRRLISRGLSQGHENRLQDNPEVKPRGPIVDVPKVVLDAGLHLLDLTCLTSIASDLRPPCQTRLDVMPKRVVGDQLFVFGVVRCGVRAWTDKR